MGVTTRSVSIFGLGYVGSVTAACLAHKGHQVIGVDVNPAKVEMFETGRSPVVETGLDELAAEGHKTCRLHATTDATAAVLNSDVSFACVGTPSHRNGKLDLAQIEHVCREIGRGLAGKDSFHTIVLRSTVLPGTTQSVVVPALERSSQKRAGVDFAVCYNPEFMREGTAVADFFEPPYTILGAEAPEHDQLIQHVTCRVRRRLTEPSGERAQKSTVKLTLVARVTVIPGATLLNCPVTFVEVWEIAWPAQAATGPPVAPSTRSSRIESARFATLGSG